MLSIINNVFKLYDVRGSRAYSSAQTHTQTRLQFTRAIETRSQRIHLAYFAPLFAHNCVCRPFDPLVICLPFSFGWFARLHLHALRLYFTTHISTLGKFDSFHFSFSLRAEFGSFFLLSVLLIYIFVSNDFQCLLHSCIG